MKTNEQLLADIRKRLDDGYTVATAERVKSIAAKRSDPELLRGMADALADAIINPKRRKAGRPRKNAAAMRGVINLDDMPALTKSETLAKVKAMVREFGICEQIYDAHVKHGANIDAECQRHHIGKSTYYKWFPADS